MLAYISALCGPQHFTGRSRSIGREGKALKTTAESRPGGQFDLWIATVSNVQIALCEQDGLSRILLKWTTLNRDRRSSTFPISVCSNEAHAGFHHRPMSHVFDLWDRYRSGINRLLQMLSGSQSPVTPAIR
jgi:hypothetical protein